MLTSIGVLCILVLRLYNNCGFNEALHVLVCLQKKMSTTELVSSSLPITTETNVVFTDGDTATTGLFAGGGTVATGSVTTSPPDITAAAVFVGGGTVATGSVTTSPPDITAAAVFAGGGTEATGSVTTSPPVLTDASLFTVSTSPPVFAEMGNETATATLDSWLPVFNSMNGDISYAYKRALDSVYYPECFFLF